MVQLILCSKFAVMFDESAKKMMKKGNKNENERSYN